MLLSVLFAAFLFAPFAYAHRTHRRPLPEIQHASRNRQKPAARTSERAHSRGRRVLAHLRPAVFRRSRHTHSPLQSQDSQSESGNTESQDQAPVLETTSLPSMRRALPSPLRGTYDSLVRQNEKTEADSLERIEDDADLDDRIARKMLVPVPVSAALNINQKLPENRRYCRPWTARFLSDLARAHAAAFHGPLEVSSAVRTVEYQKLLMKVNGNATAAEGDIASPHLTGATIDIAKNVLSRKEVAWMRAWLLPLQTAGKIDVEEEFRQSCFHITVYKSYISAAPARKPAEATANQAETAGSGL